MTASSFGKVLIRGAIATALMLSASALCVAAATNSVVYEVKMKSSAGNMGTRKMSLKGECFRWEANTAGLLVRIIKNHDGVYILDYKDRFAGKYPAGSSRENPSVFLPGPIGNVSAFLKQQKAKQTTKGTVNKKSCVAYEYTESVTKWNCRLWVTKASLTPVRLELIGKKKGTSVTADYSYYKLGVPIADSVFELPKGIPLRNVSDHLPGAAGAKTK